MRKIIFLFSLIFWTPSQAEIYQGIKPDATLGEIKALFPNANISKVKAAWVTEADGFYLMTGEGLSGSIYLAFYDRRPFQRERVTALTEQIAAVRSEPATDDSAKREKSLTFTLGLFQKWLVEPDNDALHVRWVRWVPVVTIPLARYVTKYGKPAKSGFADDDMRPFVSWPGKGVLLTLSDDGKAATMATFSFTDAEVKAECISKFRNKAACE